jgi:hypothetical protein
MMRRNNITSPEKISEFFYNMVKKNLWTYKKTYKG